MQAILDYEISQNISPGWVNYAISKSGTDGFWQKLERGEVEIDTDYFKGFKKELHNSRVWEEFYTQSMKKRNLEVDKMPPVPDVDAEWMFWEMMRVSRTPDPWMYPALKNLKASGRYLVAALSNTVIFPSDHPYSQPLPDDPRLIFDMFISSAHIGLRKPSPEIYQYAANALDKYAREHGSGKGKDLGWADGVKPSDIVFLDDIGENLKAAKKVGFGTIKVNLGEAYEAVTALEELTGLQLAGDHPRISSAPKIPKSRL